MKIVTETESIEWKGLPAVVLSGYIEGSALQTYTEVRWVGSHEDAPVEVMESALRERIISKQAELVRGRAAPAIAPELLAMEGGSLGRLPEDRR